MRKEKYILVREFVRDGEVVAADVLGTFYNYNMDSISTAYRKAVEDNKEYYEGYSTSSDTGRVFKAYNLDEGFDENHFCIYIDSARFA